MTNDQFKSKATIKWLWLMSWRDWKASRKKLYLIIASIVLGISAVVAIQSFGTNLKAQIKEDSKKLMGADFIISSRQAPTKKLSFLIDSLGGEKAEEINFASMAFFPKNEESKLVKVSGYKGYFPIYGELETVPKEAVHNYFENKGALIDATTMLQFDLKIGDSIKIGGLSFSIIGSIKSVPGKSAISSSIMPPVFIPYNKLKETGLLLTGSRVGYEYYFKTDSLENLKVLEQKLEIVLDAENANIKTHLSAGESLGKAYNNFSMFLNLVAFTALLLGCLGIASATNIYIKEKKKAIAVLKCIGVTRKQTFLIYLFQIIFIGLIGSLIGTALGLFLQQIFPILLKGFLPVGVSFFISLKVIALGIGLGVIMSVVFSLYPLISTWFVTPNQVLRAQETDNKNNKILGYIIAPSITLTVFLFSYLLLGEVLISIIFLIAIVVVFTAIRLLAGLFILLIKKLLPKKWSFPSRQGLSNLFRPGNQTITLVLCIGVGVFLINTLYFAKDGLVNNATVQKDSNIANILLLDIQKEQIPGIRKTISTFKQPVIDEIPVIAMKVHSINGTKTSALKADSTNGIKDWVLDGIFRASYRDSLISSEHILEGKWQRTAKKSEVIPISIGKGFKKAGKLELGDEIIFNVQGVLMSCKIASIRNIEWSSMQMNFSVIFPKGVMEAAPQTHVLTTKAPTDEVAAKLQRALVKKHPSVTVIDIRYLMVLVEGILSKIALVINFLALFSILTGFIVLISAVRTSKFQRLKENAMLRTIGATKKQILKMTIVEYFLLGFLGAFSGTLLSLIAGKMFAVFTFKSPFIISWIPLIFIPFLIIVLVVIIGVLNNITVIKTSPKAILKD